MANKNFIVKNGLEVGGQEVVSSSGVVTSAALGGQTLASTDSPTFNNLTLTNDIAVGGDINLTGDLNITGDVNSLSVTDLDVTDQTITLGAGQVESASGGSGIVVAGSNASILWDETNTEWDFNNPLHVTTASSVTSHVTVEETSGATTALRAGGSTGYIGTYSDHPLRITANSATKIYVATDGKIGIGSNHTNPLQTVDISGSAAGLNIQGGNNRIYFSNYRALEGATDASLLQVGEGFTNIALQGNVGIGTTSPATLLDVSGTTPTITISDSQSKSWTSSDTIYGKVSFKSLDPSGIGAHETAYVGVHADVASSTTPAGRLVFGTSNSNSAAAETMTLDGNGFLGLGTTNPSALLTMTGNSDTSDESCMIIINDEDTDVGSQVPAIQFRGNDSNIGRIRANGSLGLILSGSSAQGDDLVVQAGGVGIGTTSPGQKLHVNSAGTNVVARFESTDSIASIQLKDNTGNVELETHDGVFRVNPSGSSNPLSFQSGATSNYFTTTTTHDGTNQDFDFTIQNNVASNYGPRVRLYGGGQSTSTASDVPWDNQQGYNIGSFWFDSAEGPSVYGAGIVGYAEADFNANDTPAALAFYTTPDGTGAQTNTAKERLRLRADGTAHFSPGESDTRIYIGSSGGLTGGNSSNWVRASGSTLMYNCGGGSASHIWEVAGTQKLQVTNAYMEQRSNQADQYTIRSRNTATGDPGLSLTRDNVVGFGIAVRGATEDYADFQVNSSGATSYGETGVLRLYHNNQIAMPGNAAYNVTDGFYFYSDTGRVFQTFNYDSSGAEVFLQNNRYSSGTVAAFQYRINNSAQSGGTIYASTSGYTGGNFSDYRLKNNVTDLTGSLDKITQLRAVSYNHVNTPDKTELGFIAHEINDVFPEFVHGEKDAVWTQEDIDNYEGQLPEIEVGDIKAQQVDYFSKEWTTHILHAIKELKAKNDALEARIAELEG